jgi:hypothetical protein
MSDIENSWLQKLDDVKSADPARVFETVSSAFSLFPSPKCLSACIDLLPRIISAGLNNWTIFIPRPTAEKSGLRFMENCIDRVGLWPESGVLWTSARAFLSSIGSSPDVILKLYISQIQTVPMTIAARTDLKHEMAQFCEDKALPSVPSVDSIKADKIWKNWSALEIRSVTDPTVYPEMITKRSSIDPVEYVISLYDRYVIADPENESAWKLFLTKPGMTDLEKLRSLKRARSYIPSSVWAWSSSFECSRANGLSILDFLAEGTTAMGEEYEKIFSFFLFASNHELRSGTSKSIRTIFQGALDALVHSPKHWVSMYMVWIQSELVSTKLSHRFCSELMEKVLTQPSPVHACITPLQWVQLAWTCRAIGKLELVRSVYKLALKHVEEKHQYIIRQDELMFESSCGTTEVVRGLMDGLGALSKPSSVPVSKPREIKHPERFPASQPTPAVSEGHKTPPPRFVSTCVFMKDLPFTLSESDLADLFETTWKIGRPVKTHIVTNTAGKSRGFGYVEFADAETAQKALGMTGQFVDERPVVISPSTREITTKKRGDTTTGLPSPETTKSNEYLKQFLAQKRKRVVM